MTRYLLAAIVCLAALTCTQVCFADGKVFSREAAPPTIPDQQALICFASGIETLVIETRFQGPGSEFAWVVPVPSVPEVSASTAGLFPTLRSICRPRLIEAGSEWVAAAAWLLIVLFVGLLHRQLAIALLLSAPLVVFLMLPTLGKSRGLSAGPAEPGVQVIDRKLVGSFETATIAGTSPAELIDWLTTNGFKVEDAARPVIAQYVAEGWKFVVAKLRQDQTGPTLLTPHPLALRFKTEAPVYPLRLTGVGSAALTVDLYVLADQRAEADGFTVERCSRISPGTPAGHITPVHDGQVRLDHPELQRVAAGSTVATRLRGRLSPQQMSRDLSIRLVPFAGRAESAYSRQGAWMIVLAGGLALADVGVLIVLGLPQATLPSRRRPALGLLVALVGFSCAVVSYGFFPTVEGVGGGRPRVQTLHRDVAQSLWSWWDKRGELVPTLDQVRAAALESWNSQRDSLRGGSLPIHDDSPGNYVIRPKDRGYEYVWFDAAGKPVEDWTLSP